VEVNASRRALRLLVSSGVLREDELPGARKVLTAAALTYVAAAVQALLVLLYLILRRRR
jgi:Zn-dependent membrane protease YugP